MQKGQSVPRANVGEDKGLEDNEEEDDTVDDEDEVEVLFSNNPYLSDENDDDELQEGRRSVRRKLFKGDKVDKRREGKGDSVAADAGEVTVDDGEAAAYGGDATADHHENVPEVAAEQLEQGAEPAAYEAGKGLEAAEGDHEEATKDVPAEKLVPDEDEFYDSDEHCALEEESDEEDGGGFR